MRQFITPNNYAFAVFFSSWVAFFYNGILDHLLLGRNGAPVWLFLIIFWVGFLYFKRGVLVVIKPTDILVFIIFPALIPSLLSFFDTYFLASLSLVMCTLISIRLGSRWSLSFSQKQLIFNVGVLTSIAAIIMFAYFSLIARPVFGVDSIRPGYGYAIDRGVLLRLVGFADDPNFYAVGVLLPLLIGLGVPKLKWRTVGLVVIISSIILTFSRSGSLAIACALAAMFFSRVKLRSFVIGAVVLLLAVPIVTLTGTLIEGLKTSENVEVSRDFSSGLSGRNNLLMLAVAEQPITFWGNGLGVTKTLIGLHSHNTYFDYLYEAGFIPFLLLIICVGLACIRSVKTPNLINSYGVGVLVGAGAVSIGFQPLFILLILMGGKYVDR